LFQKKSGYQGKILLKHKKTQTLKYGYTSDTTSLLLEKHKDGLNETIIYYKYTQIKTNQISLVHKHDQLAATTIEAEHFSEKAL